jgi:hypothetical protein
MSSPARPMLLTGRQRTLVVAFGLGLTGAGCAAVLVSANDIGSVALLLLGCVAVLIGLTGRVPDRMGREGVAYEQLDGRTTEEITPDEERDEPERETLMDALRDGLYERTPTELPHVALDGGRQLWQDTRVLMFMSDVLYAIGRCPPWERVTTLDGDALSVVHADAALWVTDCPRVSDSPCEVLVDVRGRPSLDEVERDVARLAHHGPDGFVYIVSAKEAGYQRDLIEDRFVREMSKHGVHNARVVFLDLADVDSVTALENVMTTAMDTLKWRHTMASKQRPVRSG